MCVREKFSLSWVEDCLILPLKQKGWSPMTACRCCHHGPHRHHSYCHHSPAVIAAIVATAHPALLYSKKPFSQSSHYKPLSQHTYVSY